MAHIDHTACQCIPGQTQSRCMFCGQHPHAFWQGMHGAISVCTNCAEEVLPALIADSVLVTNHPREYAAGNATNSWIKCERRFWKAFASRLSVYRRTDT